MILGLLATAASAAAVPPSAEQVLAGYESRTWTAFYMQAAKLHRKGQTEEAALLFYAGQFRARASIMCNRGAPDGDQALLGSLNYTVGGPINEAVGSSVKRWLRVVDATLAWTDRHVDPAAPQPRCAKPITEVRAGLVKLRAMLAADPDAIWKGRTQNGLPNDPE